jgi:hypothetical protein
VNALEQTGLTSGQRELVSLQVNALGWYWKLLRQVNAQDESWRRLQQVNAQDGDEK